MSPPLPLATSRLVERGQGCLSWEWHILCHPLPPERLGRMFYRVQEDQTAPNTPSDNPKLGGFH